MVKIIKWNVLYGTGDYEDPEEICEDRNIECYYVLFENIMCKDVFNVGGGGFLSLGDAVSDVESKVEVKWML